MTNQHSIKIVLLDDNLAVRFALQNILDEFSDLDFQLYAADEGVEGLGYIYVTSPEIIIIDTTLPKYSGREVIDFLLTNNKLNSKTKVLVLHDGAKNLNDLPEKYILLRKKDRDFVNKFKNTIASLIQGHNTASKEKDLNKLVRFFKSISVFINRQLLRWGTVSDLFMQKLSQPVGLNSFYLIPWVFSQIILSFLFAFSMIYSHKHKNSNISQNKKDLKAFRVRAYPTLVTVFSTLFFILFQFFLFLTGGLILFGSLSFRSIFAYNAPEFEINLADSLYDKNKIISEDGDLKLKPDLSDVTVVTFNQSVPYTKLVEVVEERSESGLGNKSVTYQLSPNNSDWYYFDKGQWVNSSLNPSGSNNIEILNKGLESFQKKFIGGSLYIRAFFKNNSEADLILKGLKVVRELKAISLIE